MRVISPDTGHSQGPQRDDPGKEERCWCWSRWSEHWREARGSTARSLIRCQRTPVIATLGRRRGTSHARRSAGCWYWDRGSRYQRTRNRHSSQRSGNRHRSVFGAHAGKLAVSSTSPCGHALGAAGALEAVATVLALRNGVLPPTANYREADPECDLDVIPNQSRKADVEVALSNSFAFGGLNAVLAFRKYPA